MIISDAISIHAPLTGSDMSPQHRSRRIYNFNPRSPYGERLFTSFMMSFPFISIHAPLTGSDHIDAREEAGFTVFQSTLPLRGATVKCGGSKTTNLFQSTLPLRGATDAYRRKKQSAIISIHAPLTGSDMASSASWISPAYISIHAPLTGSDVFQLAGQ